MPLRDQINCCASNFVLQLTKKLFADKLAEQRKVLADKEGSAFDNITYFLSSLFDNTRGLPDFITFSMPNPLLNF